MASSKIIFKSNKTNLSGRVTDKRLLISQHKNFTMDISLIGNKLFNEIPIEIKSNKSNQFKNLY